MKALLPLLIAGLIGLSHAHAQPAPEGLPASQGVRQSVQAEQAKTGDKLAPSRTPGTVSDSWSVIQVQGALKQRGYDVGAVDGLMGPKTRDALRRFQEESKLQASGEIDRETLAALDIRLQREIATTRYGASPSGWVSAPGSGARGNVESGGSRGFNTVGNAPMFIPGTPAPSR